MAFSLFRLNEAEFASSSESSKKPNRLDVAPNAASTDRCLAPSAVDPLDDDNDDWFASVPMPDEACGASSDPFDNDDMDDDFYAAGVVDPAMTGTLSYGAADAAVGSGSIRPAPSTVPKKHPQAPSTHTAQSGFHPVAQSTQVSRPVITSQATPQSHKQQQQPTPQSRRRFPGPAGRLPRLRDAAGGGGGNGAFDAASRVLQERAKAAAAAADEAAASQRQRQLQQQQQQSSSQASSQSSSSCQDDESWSAAVADLGPSLSRFLRRYGIAQVTDMVASGRLPRNKVPAMLVCVDSLDPSAVDCVAALRDPTGRIQAALHQRVFKELRDRVRPGSALVLRRVTLFSADGRSHYLNITMDNVVRIYDREGIPSLPPTSGGSASTSSASVCSLTEADLLRLEAECLRPRSPTVTPQTSRVVPPQSSGATVKRRSDELGGSNFRIEDDDVASAAAAADSAYKRSRYASLPQNHQTPKHQQHHQHNQWTPGSSSRHYPASVPHQQVRQVSAQPPQQHQRSLQSSVALSSPAMSAEERNLQQAYMDLLDDNMDDLLASALDDL